MGLELHFPCSFMFMSLLPVALSNAAVVLCDVCTSDSVIKSWGGSQGAAKSLKYSSSLLLLQKQVAIAYCGVFSSFLFIKWTFLNQHYFAGTFCTYNCRSSVRNFKQKAYFYFSTIGDWEQGNKQKAVHLSRPLPVYILCMVDTT